MKFSTFEITMMVEVICMIVMQRGKSLKKSMQAKTHRINFYINMKIK